MTFRCVCCKLLRFVIFFPRLWWDTFTKLIIPLGAFYAFSFIHTLAIATISIPFSIFCTFFLLVLAHALANICIPGFIFSTLILFFTYWYTFALFFIKNLIVITFLLLRAPTTTSLVVKKLSELTFETFRNVLS